jgi:hypothetical protein
MTNIKQLESEPNPPELDMAIKRAIALAKSLEQ